MPSYKTAFGSFLKSEDLQGRAVRAQITSVTLESVTDQDTNTKERKLVAHFHGTPKGLILNRTNADALNHIFGTDDYDQWRGLVELFVDPSVKFGGRTVSGLRVRAAAATQAVRQAAAPQPVAPPPPAPAQDVVDGFDSGFVAPVEELPGGPVTDDDIPF